MINLFTDLLFFLLSDNVFCSLIVRNDKIVKPETPIQFNHKNSFPIEPTESLSLNLQLFSLKLKKLGVKHECPCVLNTIINSQY